MICHEPLYAQPFGITVPCGHGFHVECYNQWAKLSQKMLPGGELVTKCPTCNGQCTNFTRAFIDLKVDCDEVSISSDEGSDASFADANQDIDCGSGYSGGNYTDADAAGSSKEEDVFDFLPSLYEPLEEVNERPDGTFTRSNSAASRSVAPSSVQEDYSLLNSDYEEMLRQPFSSPSTQASLKLRKKKNLRPRSTACADTNQKNTSSNVAKSNTISTNDQKLQRKYKMKKKQVRALKGTIRKLQEVKNKNDKYKSDCEKAEKNIESLSSKLELESLNHSSTKRKLKDLEETSSRYQNEIGALKSRLSEESKMLRNKIRVWRDEAESSKASRMNEMKKICEENDKYSSKYNELLEEYKRKDKHCKSLEKENANLTRRLMKYSDEIVSKQNLSPPRKKMNQKSRTERLKAARQVQHEIDNARMAEEEESIMLQKKYDNKNMRKNLSSQSRKAFSLGSKKLKVKSRPSLLKSVMKPSSAPIAPAPQVNVNKQIVGKPISNKNRPPSDIRGFWNR